MSELGFVILLVFTFLVMVVVKIIIDEDHEE